MGFRNKLNYLLGLVGMGHRELSENAYQVRHHRDEALKSAKKLCFFSHFSANGDVEEYVFHYLGQLKACGYTVAFCSTSPNLSPLLIKKLSGTCDLIMVRKNIGFDFGSWAAIHHYLNKLNSHYTQNLDQFLLTNDSIYGPVQPLKVVFDKMEKRRTDFWGLTNNYEIDEHVQSFFVVFNKSVLQTTFIYDFFKSLKLYRHKQHLINQCEVGLTQKLLAVGFQYEVLCPYEEVIDKAPHRTHTGSKVNTTVHYWDILVSEFEFPFIKRVVIRDNARGVLKYCNPNTLISEPSLQSSSHPPGHSPAE